MSLLQVYETLKEVYSSMVEEDPSNGVFGSPKDFYRILEEKEYADDVDTSKVVLGIETAEQLLDCKKFQACLEKRLRNHANITIHEFTELRDVERRADDENNDKNQKRYCLSFQNREKRSVFFSCDYVVNSTWYQIEQLNSLAGFPEQSFTITNRLKALLHVKLPASMFNFHSMFFCIGPFCMLSNLGDGTAYITYAPVTNIATSNRKRMSKKMRRFLNGNAAGDEVCNIAEGILDGAASFIPGLKDAEILRLSFGIVQTLGGVDIYDANSAFHRRNDFAVRSEGEGWISNPCMKLVYMLENADIVVDLLEKQFECDCDDVILGEEAYRLLCS